MGFENALRDIEREPKSEEKMGAYLQLVSQEKKPDRKAEAYANLAQAVLQGDPLAALGHIESAFKLSPHNAVVLRTLVSLFERRGRRDAADAVRAHQRSLVAGAEGASSAPARAASPAIQKPIRDGKGNREVRGLKAVTAASRAPKAGDADLCRTFLRDLRLNESLLHAASEFAHSSHSVVGLVHFCHYLVFTGRIGSDARAAEAIAWVKEHVLLSSATTRARARFGELLEPYSQERR